MALQAVNSVYMFVNNIRESEAWYSKLLKKKPDYYDDNFSLFRLNNTLLCFHLYDEKSPISTGGTVVYWWTDNFDVTLKEIVGMGATLYRGPIPSEQGLQICQFKDPFGNVFGLEGRIED